MQIVIICQFKVLFCHLKYKAKVMSKYSVEKPRKTIIYKNRGGDFLQPLPMISNPIFTTIEFSVPESSIHLKLDYMDDVVRHSDLNIISCPK